MTKNINTQRLLNQFLELVKISSPSRQEGDFAEHMRRELVSLGFTVDTAVDVLFMRVLT